jgi:hypothetical protein
MYHRIICADGNVKEEVYKRLQMLLYTAIYESNKKLQMSSVLLRYDVQSRRIWIAAFICNVPPLFTNPKNVSGFSDFRFKVGINYSLT